MKPVLIIAEAGVNHNGDEQLAYQLVDAAIAAGVDVVKFQTFKANNLVTESAKQASYQAKNIGKEESQHSMLKKLELSFGAHQRIQKYCQQHDIIYLSTAFDFESLDFLVNDLKLSTLKIPSGEVTNAPFVLAHARTGKKLILSTGMCTMTEIEDALSIIAFGLLNAQDKLLELPLLKSSFSKAYQSEAGQALLKEKVTVLHCTTAYPAALNSINLAAMDSLKTQFNLPIGYSDHSQGISIPVAAVARGAGVIEKHFTLDKTMSGPDHKASLDPKELMAMTVAIREVSQAIGDGIKAPTAIEVENMAVARKSLVANVDIKEGEVFTDSNLTIKRPGNGMSPDKYWQTVGIKASQDYQAGELISE